MGAPPPLTAPLTSRLCSLLLLIYFREVLSDLAVGYEFARGIDLDNSPEGSDVCGVYIPIFTPKNDTKPDYFPCRVCLVSVQSRIQQQQYTYVQHRRVMCRTAAIGC